MTKYKIVPDTGNSIVIDGFEGMTVEDLLKAVSSKMKIDLKQHILTEPYSKSTYMTPDAILPATVINKKGEVTENVTLFTTIKDPKGNSERSDLYDAIKAAYKTNEAAAKAHFNKEKSYTNKTTQEIASLVAAWNKKVNKGAAKAPVMPAKVSTKEAVKVETSPNLKPVKASDADFMSDEEARAIQRSFSPRFTRTR